MTKTLPRQPKQLEMPLFVDLNGKNPQSPNQSLPTNAEKPISAPVGETASLKATADDLTIYRSISDNFFRQFK